jgi:hypothetical protein
VKKPISVTIRDENLLWLKGQAAATTEGNVSKVLDRLVDQARAGGLDVASRSVVGTIDLPSDGTLDQASSYVRVMFERSLRRPLVVKERAPRGRSRRG